MIKLSTSKRRRITPNRSLLAVLWLISGFLAGTPQAWAQDEKAEGDEAKTAIAEIPAKASSFSTQNKPELIAKELDADQVMWLPVGSQKILTLYNAENSGKARGGVILIPRHERPLGELTLLNNLQQTLSNNHWHALTISMPPIAVAPPKTSTKQALAPKEPKEESSVEMSEPQPQAHTEAATPAVSVPTIDYEAQAQQHIEAAVQFFNDKGIFNMVILGEGSGGNRAINYINGVTDRKRKKQIRGLAMINADNYVEGNATKTTTLIPKIVLPILDIYFDNNLRYPQEAKKRLRSSRALPKGQYQQIKMPAMRSSWNTNEDRLSKRIRGWLERTAAGFSVGVH